MIAVKLNGVDALNAKLRGLSYDIQKKGGRSALRAAAKIVADAAKVNAQQLDDKATGRSIAMNIGMRWASKLNKQTGDLGFRIGVQGGAKSPPGSNPDAGANGPTPHWRFLEFGTERQKATPFMRPALEQNLQRVADTFIVKFGQSIDRAIKKGAT